MGEAAGADGSVTQTSHKGATVTLNAPCGVITTHNGFLDTGASAIFTVNNNTVSPGDVVVVTSRDPNHRVEVADIASGSFIIRLTNLTEAALFQAVVINFAVLNVVTA